MAYPKTLIMVRHGQSEANLVQKGKITPPEGFYARSDVHMRLSAEGVRQARITGEWLKENGYNFDRHYVSPFLRTVETALNMDINEEWLLDDLWRERDWGEYGRYSRAEQVSLFKDSTAIKEAFAWYWKPQGGESLATGVRLRVNSVLTHLARLEDVDAVVGVSHGEFMSTAQFVLDKMTPHEWVKRDTQKEFTVWNASVLEYTRVNPYDSSDVRNFYTWKRVTCPWDKNLSHKGGEWEELVHKEYNSIELRSLVESYPNLLP